MKKLLRLYLVELLSLYLVTQLASGIYFENSFEGILVTALALSVASYLLKPVINILLLPLTLATLGIFKFIASAIALYIVDLAVNQFEIVGFNFGGFHTNYFDIPAFQSEQKLIAYVIFSFLISFLSTFINWIRK